MRPQLIRLRGFRLSIPAISDIAEKGVYLFQCGDGGNRTRVQKKIIQESTCLEYSLVLNVHPREYTKQMNTELLIVEINLKRLLVRNPIILCPSYISDVDRTDTNLAV